MPDEQKTPPAVEANDTPAAASKVKPSVKGVLKEELASGLHVNLSLGANNGIIVTTRDGLSSTVTREELGAYLTKVLEGNL